MKKSSICSIHRFWGLGYEDTWAGGRGGGRALQVNAVQVRKEGMRYWVYFLLAGEICTVDRVLPKWGAAGMLLTAREQWKRLGQLLGGEDKAPREAV